MFEAQQTAEFSRWLADLRDAKGRAAILTPLGRLALGNAGDTSPLRLARKTGLTREALYRSRPPREIPRAATGASLPSRT